MRKWQYVTTVTLGATCAVISVALVILSQMNVSMQAQIQIRQQQLNSGIMGPQGQQIANSILQDMEASAASNRDMRDLLGKHGYNIPGAATATNATETASEEE